ncbi:PREDICTED: uncharacterized protein LOC109345443 isoform X2 [Lupinus angustifolius]|uniref:uncharacterized protein LOC109345443 isoform X2 n=1 Tax=Lupinus angustifolius TaxID=3871 RepID=UPI00092E7F4F|nr:PREDICTED: uncharacterized protein LOC109345443 isoform X2 [Lupinus angustifolius]
MAPFSLTGPTNCNSITSFSPLLFYVTYNSSNISLPRKLHRNVNVHSNSLSPFSYQSSFHRNLCSMRKRGISLIAFDAKNSESGSEDNKTMDKNTDEFSNIPADECRGVCNFLSFFQGKMQVLKVFSNLIKMLRRNIRFEVKHTVEDGMDVGVHWKFEWNKIHVPLGKGWSFHLYQTYRGKAVIRNFEMLMEPLHHLEPFKLKMITSLTKLVEIISLYEVSESGIKAKWKLCIVLAVLSLASLLLFMKIVS